MNRLERHESSRGRTTPEVTWRLWNDRRDSYQTFKTKREAVAMYAIDAEVKADNDPELAGVLYRRGRISLLQYINLTEPK